MMSLREQAYGFCLVATEQESSRSVLVGPHVHNRRCAAVRSGLRTIRHARIVHESLVAVEIRRGLCRDSPILARVDTGRTGSQPKIVSSRQACVTADGSAATR